MDFEVVLNSHNVDFNVYEQDRVKRAADFAALNPSASVDAVLEHINTQGNNAMLAMSNQLVEAATPKERVYKIARVLKGKRIPLVSPSGKRYSYGPKWNASVLAGNGDTLKPIGREKLEMQARFFGIEFSPEISSKELVVLVAEGLRKSEQA